MRNYLVDEGDYKGFFKLLIILWLFLILTTGIAYLPKVGLDGFWVEWTSAIEPLVLLVWYINFVAYMVVNR